PAGLGGGPAPAVPHLPVVRRRTEPGGGRLEEPPPVPKPGVVRPDAEPRVPEREGVAEGGRVEAGRAQQLERAAGASGGRRVGELDGRLPDSLRPLDGRWRTGAARRRRGWGWGTGSGHGSPLVPAQRRRPYPS